MAVAATSCPVLQLGLSVGASVQEMVSRAPQGVHMTMARPSLSFPRRLHLFERKERMDVVKPGLSSHICRAAGGNGNGSSCCGGGSGESGSSGGCSDRGSSAKDLPPVETDGEVLGIGKEFEALVATKTMEEFESQYESGKMEGTISRNVIDDVKRIYAEGDQQSRKASEEKFLDVDELLAEARALSASEKDGLVFDADFEDMLV